MKGTHFLDFLKVQRDKGSKMCSLRVKLRLTSILVIVTKFFPSAKQGFHKAGFRMVNKKAHTLTPECKN